MNRPYADLDAARGIRNALFLSLGMLAGAWLAFWVLT